MKVFLYAHTQISSQSLNVDYFFKRWANSQTYNFMLALCEFISLLVIVSILTESKHVSGTTSHFELSFYES